HKVFPERHRILERQETFHNQEPEITDLTFLVMLFTPVRYIHFARFYQFIHYLLEIVINTRLNAETKVEFHKVHVVFYNGINMVTHSIRFIQYVYVYEPVDVGPF